MAYDLEEQEQLDNLKDFWRKYGGLILGVVLVGLLIFTGVRGWAWYQTSQSANAGVVYEELRKAAAAGDSARVRETAGALFADYSRTPWAQMAAMTAAEAHLKAGDAEAAKMPLRWATESAQDPAYRDEARLRLAGVLLDQKAYDEALALLNTPAEQSYAGAFADRRGDLLAAQGKRDEALAAYRQAAQVLAPDSALRRLLQVKVDALGGEGA